MVVGADAGWLGRRIRDRPLSHDSAPRGDSRGDGPDVLALARTNIRRSITRNGVVLGYLRGGDPDSGPSADAPMIAQRVMSDSGVPLADGVFPSPRPNRSTGTASGSPSSGFVASEFSVQISDALPLRALPRRHVRDVAPLTSAHRVIHILDRCHVPLLVPVSSAGGGRAHAASHAPCSSAVAGVLIELLGVHVPCAQPGYELRTCGRRLSLVEMTRKPSGPPLRRGVSVSGGNFVVGSFGSSSAEVAHRPFGVAARVLAVEHQEAAAAAGRARARRGAPPDPRGSPPGNPMTTVGAA